VNDKKDPDGREVFRSPGAIVVWWVWVLFAAGNLIDIAVQGRDHLSLVAAFILLFVTGIVYVTAKRPRLVADSDGLTIVNPVRDHRVSWAAIAGADSTDLLRIRCEWLEGARTGRQVIYSWAVHTSRRRQLQAELRGRRQQQRGGRASPGIFGGGAGGFGFGGLGGGFAGTADSAPAPEGDPLRLDADKVVATLTERAEQARLEAPGDQAARPVATWDWRAVAAVVIPGLALLIAAFA
jgi:Bacterial PH domain